MCPGGGPTDNEKAPAPGLSGRRAPFSRVSRRRGQLFALDEADVRAARAEVDLQAEAADAGEGEADAQGGDHRDRAAGREADAGAVRVADPADDRGAHRRTPAKTIM